MTTDYPIPEMEAAVAALYARQRYAAAALQALIANAPADMPLVSVISLAQDYADEMMAEERRRAKEESHG